MRAEFFRDEDPERPVGIASWRDGAVAVESDHPAVREALGRAFRPSPVSVSDPAARERAAAGPAMVEHGDLAWFRAAALVRGDEEGFRVRFVTEAPGGWDPAGAYRPLEAWVMAREGSPPPRTLGTSRA